MKIVHISVHELKWEHDSCAMKAAGQVIILGLCALICCQKYV